MTPSARHRFPFVRPAVPAPDEWLPFLSVAYEQRWFSNGGPLATRLERELAEHCADTGREAVVVASATAGLVATLLALDVRGPVAIPSFTFTATAHAVEMAGCTPVFCDVDPGTWELSPASVERAVRRNGCRAIVHVRSFGFCRDSAALQAVADAAGIPLVLDSASAFGGRLDDGTPAGGAGAAEVFSFHATKVFAVGEGGAILAPPDLAARLRSVRNFSLAGENVVARGLNAKLSEFPAAVGLAMLRRLDEHLAARRAAVERLARAANTASVSLPRRPGRPAWQGLPLLVDDPVLRDAARNALAAAGIEARAYYSPGLHRTDAFAHCAAEALPVTEWLSDRMLCLPIYADFTECELDELAGAVASALGAASCRPRAVLRAVRDAQDSSSELARSSSRSRR